MNNKQLIYIPGLLPKPDPVTHRDALFRCLRHGLRTVDATLEAGLTDDAFELVAWTWDFYHEERDFGLDAASVDALLAQTEASAFDRSESRSVGRRFNRFLRRAADHVPFIVPYLADDRVRRHITDLKDYNRDRDGRASEARRKLRDAMLKAGDEGRPVMLLAHSMGSVIAWDTLWSLQFEDRNPFELDTLFTMGSPLGQRFVRHHIKGCGRDQDSRYPANIRHWINASAIGDMTAANRALAPVFTGMRDQLQTQRDIEVDNWFRLDGELNPHAEYGYLANPTVAGIIADWLKA